MVDGKCKWIQSLRDESQDPAEVPGKNDGVRNGEWGRVVAVVGSNLFCGEDAFHPTNFPSLFLPGRQALGILE